MTALRPAAETCLLRRAGPPHVVANATMRIYDARLAKILDPASPLLCLYDQAIHSEGPVWEPRRERLIFSDVAGRRLLAWSSDGRIEVVLDATPFINGNALDADRCLVHCEHLRRCISRSPRDDAPPEPFITHFEGRRLNTPNDITTARDGALWFTDPTFGLMLPQQGCLADPELDHRSVYRHDPKTGALRRMADFDQPNGIFFSPDGATLYVSDTSRAIGGATHDIVAFDVGANTTLTNRRVFCQTKHGVPDGFLVDGRGWVWTTAGDGLHVFDSAGLALGFLPTPSTGSNCAFGGLDGRRLFITAEQNLFAIDLRSHEEASATYPGFAQPAVVTANEAGVHGPARLARRRPPDGFSLRARTAADTVDLFDLFNEPSFLNDASTHGTFASPEMFENWLNAIAPCGRYEIVAQQGENVVAFGGLYPFDDPMAHCGALILGVREAHQNCGLGSTILQMLLEQADVMAGLSKIVLTVFEHNSKALRLYRDFGFEIEGLHRRFSRRGAEFVNAYSMALFFEQPKTTTAG